MKNLFLGLDCSTQSLTGIIVELESSKVLSQVNINFDKELSKYQTQNGVIILENGIVIHSYPLMWIEALELLFAKFNNEKIPIPDIKAICGSAQQHGTVYLNKAFESVLKKIDIEKSLVDQIKPTLSRPTSPIWMDSSTKTQCDEIRNKLGGLKSSVEILGSDIIERFSGPQIRKFYQNDPKAYNNTSKIHLVSSFMASILIGKSAPMDHGDGAGMNLMNIKIRQWDILALNATAPNLKEKLPPLVKASTIIGKISPYFVKNYNFNVDTILIVWSGDNPSSLIGVGLVKKGKVAVSLGTSDTYFAYLDNLYLDYKGEGHVFGSPTGNYMGLICYKNGSLARERIKNKFKLNWNEFSEILIRTPPGNNGKIMLPYFFPEIVPNVSEAKVYRFGFNEDDREGNIRAIIEAQFLSMRLHSEWIGENPKEIYATGGASLNIEILQILASIFNTPVRLFEVTQSAALGAAFRAIKPYEASQSNKLSWEEIINRFIDFNNTKVIVPDNRYIELYNDMLELYRKYEDYIHKNKENPELSRQEFIKKYFKSN
ncbi:MAG: xylulokinase [Promethearchaeota archaeon]